MKGFRALYLVCAMQFASMRWFWRSLLVGGIAIPLFALILWRFMSGGMALPGSELAHILAGNIVISLLFGNMGRVASRLSFLKDSGALDYYAALGVGKLTLILAVILVFLVASLPGMLIALSVGTFWLRVPIQPHPLLVPALALGSVSLSTLGAAVGVYSRTPEESNTLENLLALGLMVLSPVLVPPARLPKVFMWTSYLVPTTYVTQAVRRALVSQVDLGFWLNLGILAVFCVVSLALVHAKLDWRD